MTVMASRISTFALVFLISSVQQVYAEGFGINATRVIYRQQDKSVQVVMRNTTAASVYLVRSGVVNDQGVPVESFEVIPPLFRLDAGSEGAVRVMQRPGNTFPADRESLFYFYSLAIPSTNPLTVAGRETLGQLRVTVGNRIKFIYRPASLPVPDSHIFQQVTFSRVPAGVQVKNPTPYYISLSSLRIDGVSVPLSDKGSELIAPFGSRIYLSRSRNKQAVKWSVINDIGATESFTAAVR
ncbi:fimbrial biogenesis chaperone [Serratia proteamaculans]|uniref:fimbrial biogenesis chaperone n=1 Tax=Serratia proteamaculans TaxID=28151 RepID=UPI002176F6F4|nr:molecular chaperone [Serratia proteamaculans]CAI1209415.1 Chaperone protein fimC precursor [Serratia proteamaculans]